MKNIIKSAFLLIIVSLFAGCDSYDDDRIKKELEDIEGLIAEYENRVQLLSDQMSSLTGILNSSFISLITQDAEGNNVISYTNNNGDMHSIIIATQNEVITQPIVTALKDTDGKYYWAQTTDKGKTYVFITDDKGSRFPVGGTMPEVKIDNKGYWSINGNSTGVLAQDLSNVLFKTAYIDDTKGEAVFILADGQELRISLQEALGIRFNTPLYNSITDYDSSITVQYETYGSQSANAYIDLFTAYNMEVKVDKTNSTLTLSLKPGTTEGNILLLASAGNNTVLKPLYFTYGTAEIQDPLYQGAVGPIQVAGNQSSIQVQISSNISYDTTTEDDWIIYTGTRTLVTTNHTFNVLTNETGDERRGKIMFSNSLYNISANITVIQAPKEVESKGGISTPTDLMNFAKAVNNGSSTTPWQNEKGEVVLLNDIDMASITSWTPIGDVDASAYSTSEPYKAVNPFKGIFDGKGFTIKNLNYTVDISDGRLSYGLFGSIENATIRNLKLGVSGSPVTWTFSGIAPKYTVIAPLVCYAKNAVIEACTNFYNVDFVGDNKNGELVIISGLVGTVVQTRIGAKDLTCINRGFVRSGVISNTANGGTGMQTAGICGVMSKSVGNELNYCINYGSISSPTGRTGGLVATLMYGNIRNSDNRGTVEDDKVGQYSGKEASQTYNLKRMGGLVGGTDDLTKLPEYTVEYCTNYGNVITYLSARTGGFVGHSNIQIIGCVNKGAVLGDVFVEGNGTNRHGPGWACGFSGASTATWINCKGCAIGGYVGSLQYKDDPTSAPEATNEDAFCHANSRYDSSINF